MRLRVRRAYVCFASFQLCAQMAMQFQVCHWEADPGKGCTTLWRDFQTPDNEYVCQWWIEWVQQGRPDDIQKRCFKYVIDKIEYFIDFGKMTQTRMDSQTIRRIQVVILVS